MDAQELVQASISLASRKSIHPVSEDAVAEAAAVAATGKGGGRSGRRPKPVHMGRAERESLADALLRSANLTARQEEGGGGGGISVMQVRLSRVLQLRVVLTATRLGEKLVC